MKFPLARRLQASGGPARGDVAHEIFSDTSSPSQPSSNNKPPLAPPTPITHQSKTMPAGFVESINGPVVTGWSANPGAIRFVDRVRLSIGSLDFDLDTTIRRGDVDEGGFEDNDCGFVFDLESLSNVELKTLLEDAGAAKADLAISARSVITNHELGTLCSGVSAVHLERLIEERDNREHFGTVGAVDGLRQGSIVGWCVFTRASEIAHVSLKVDGVLVCSAFCDRVRNDVEAHYGKVYAGFELPFPLAAFDGRPHLVEVSESISGHALRSRHPP